MSTQHHLTGGHEPEVAEPFDRIVDEGRQRLERPLLSLVATGLIGGIDIGFGILAYLVVKHETGDALLASLAFSIGFVALLLARSELFTENFLVPVTSVAAKQGTPVQLLRLWGVTAVTNIVGGGLIMWLLVTARPDLGGALSETGLHYAELGVGLRSFALAVLAGAVITLLTRMQMATESTGVQLVPAVLFGPLLVGAELFHCILDTLFVLGAMMAGADVTALDALVVFAWAAVGNVVGGVGLVTAIRLLRVTRKLSEARQAA
ncbi:formate/nitrite transporter family protein [Nocardioides bruguierae]|uniref:formate/nitrite transporter family protein n=1 Tax=Nocardioides bruguierae TaxID=2945102 RepID=UPI0020215597|nr:formate/nitrite transporter family protein [Nocardioides bruguierae]MCL8024470.1 formate/nitrite transporter family protein [Nocardioides bruguierae]